MFGIAYIFTFTTFLWIDTPQKRFNWELLYIEGCVNTEELRPPYHQTVTNAVVSKYWEFVKWLTENLDHFEECQI